MASLDDAKDLITAMPEVVEGTRYGRPTWFVHDKGFAWERPFSKADIKRFGDEPVPHGPILALAVEDLPDKSAVLAAGHDGVFTIAHFDAWLACPPEPLAQSYLSERSTD